MTERYFIGNLRTGRRIIDLPVYAGNWSDNLLTAETIQCSFKTDLPELLPSSIGSSTLPTQNFLAVADGDQILAAGPIWHRTINKSAKLITLNAGGLASYYDYRLILPVLAQSYPTNQWLVPDPADETRTIPNPVLTTFYNGISLGTIMKRLVQQAHAWTGGQLPVIFRPDELDDNADNQRTYFGIDFKNLGEALAQISEVRNGPEYNFQARFMTDKLGVEWEFQTGTKAQPLIFANSEPLTWDFNLEQTAADNLIIDDDGTQFASYVWQTGGRQADTVLVSRAYDPTLVNANFPLMESADSSHSSVTDQNLLNSYAQADVNNGKRLSSVWSFDALRNPLDERGLPYGPRITEYTTGDFIKLRLPQYDPITNRGDVVHPEGGESNHRIVGRSGNLTSSKISIKCAPKLETV